MTNLENYAILINDAAASKAAPAFVNRSVQHIIFDATSTISYRLDVEYIGQPFNRSLYLKEHCLGRRTAAKMIVREAKKNQLTAQSLEQLLKRYAFWILVPKAKSNTGKTANAELKKIQNGSTIVRYNQYVEVLERCGYVLTNASKKELKTRWSVR